MITFQQLLESRLAPLYHSTLPYTAARIIQSNKMVAAPSTNGNFDAISLTRSLPFALAWRDAKTWDSQGSFSVVFEFDQLALTARYKVKPYNDFPHEGARSQQTATAAMGVHHKLPHGFSNQFEEVVLGDIDNVIRYINRLIVRDVTQFAELAQHVNIPQRKLIDVMIRSHPKLYDMATKRFVNV